MSNVFVLAVLYGAIGTYLISEVIPFVKSCEAYVLYSVRNGSMR